MPNKLAAGHLGWGDGGLGGHRFVIRARWWIVQREGSRWETWRGERDGLACLARPFGSTWKADGQVTSHDGEAGVPAAHLSTAIQPWFVC